MKLTMRDIVELIIFVPLLAIAALVVIPFAIVEFIYVRWLEPKKSWIHTHDCKKCGNPSIKALDWEYCCRNCKEAD